MSTPSIPTPELTLDYVFTMPSRVPNGRVLVHNVLPTRWGRGFLSLGSRGFRAWLEPSDRLPRLYVCGCGWAPKLGAHYRVTRD